MMIKLALAAAIVVSGLHGGWTKDHPPRMYHLTECYTWDAAEDDDAAYEKAEDLIDRGWYGVPGDGAERLYSPGCRE